MTGSRSRSKTRFRNSCRIRAVPFDALVRAGSKPRKGTRRRQMAITVNQARTLGNYSGRIDVTRRPARRSRKAAVALWTVQGVLAVVFLFAGGMKLAMPMEMLAAVAPLPA